MFKVLIIDDEKDICFLISEILKDEKYLTYSALDSNEAINQFNKYNPDLVILDVWLSNSKLDGIEILKEFKQMNSNVPVIIITGHANVEMAVNSLKHGAFEFIEKPFDQNRLLNFIKRAVENLNLKSQNKDYENKLFYSY